MNNYWIVSYLKNEKKNVDHNAMKRASDAPTALYAFIYYLDNGLVELELLIGKSGS